MDARFGRLTVDYGLALFILCTLGFVLPRLLPGDPFLAIYGEEALLHMTPETKAAIISSLSLDKPPGEQFAAYWLALLRGDLGWSYFFQAPVLSVIGGFLPWTLLLSGSALVLSTTAGFVAGVESGARRGSGFDRYSFTALMALGGIPDFFIGALLLLAFAVHWPLFPLGGAMTVFGGKSGWALYADVLRHLALPLASLFAVRLASVYLLTRNTVVGLLGSPFIRTAMAKGCPAATIRYRHIGRSALLPLATTTGLQLAHLFAGVLMIEILFGYPGMGALFGKALAARDYPLLQGILIIGTLTVLATNFLVDALYPILDARMRNICTSVTQQR